MIETLGQTISRKASSRSIPAEALRRFSALICAAVIAAAMTACGGDDDSAGRPAPGITKIEIASRAPAFDGAAFGAVGSYEILRGKAYGAFDPANPAHARLALIDKAPRNADGLVEYSMDFNILRPVDSSKGSGKIFFDVVNRGNPPSFGTLNKGSLTAAGNGFLMRQGYEVVWAGWQPEANPITAGNKAYFPVASNEGQPIVAPVMEVFIPDTPEAGSTQTVEGNILTASITYAPATKDIAGAKMSLTVREDFDDPRTSLQISAVTFSEDFQVRLDMTEALAKGFDAGAIYELIYDAKDPYVGGVGFVSVRDLVSFLRNETRDTAGNENPARPGGMAIKSAFGWGNSQSGRFLKDFVYQGFSADLNGRLVFDGIHPIVTGARMTDHNTAFAMTSRWIRQHEERNYPGGSFPFTYATLFDPISGRTDGVLDRCSKANTCPKIFHQDSDYETWHGFSSLVVTDTTGNPVDIPVNVRLYQMSGQGHGPGNGTPNVLAICKLASNPVDDSAVYRALIVAMDEWITKGVAPPASMYPNRQNDTLQTIAEAKATWPTIPGYPFNERIAPARLGDFTVLPPTFGADYPLFVSKFDAQGTGAFGVVGPDLAAPLGTYMGRNFRKAGHAEDELCAGNSGVIPLARTLAERTASGDSRPSLQELYPAGAADFVATRRAQVRKLIDLRLALPEELDSYTAEVSYPQ